ncbi:MULTISPECIES: NAD(P)H-binding protein [unclassified Actinomyces]|uniref:NAD(P)H-binding protein n=1 Tax=unclassified Actinomyces TaxID=2609248 RepID=UPI002016E195|nr:MULTISPECIES: NAD(P)H-binding protein [unclassified Actinomyces]MCL3778304.1 NAD(P)H-binding protein [Actinomyces sp. AC-20-1]MCL3788766.1 NAD(P)H-binding protein [Actinomyces sp. 187325]MCL3791634.1 NAD(P)H-binding protein [Actinomyces sp. 186855]MCL3794297.1 NAD(P)H-binding protein [Actinomyces sp. 217892]
MSTTLNTVAVIGATGTIGRLVVNEALRQAIAVRAQTRSAARARRVLPGGREGAAGLTVVEADPTSSADLASLVTGVDAVVLTHSGDSDGRDGESFYEVVLALLDALDAVGEGAAHVHLSLMTSMNASRPGGTYPFMDWKRRAERLVRASGRPSTIIRPGWFNHQGAEDTGIEILQGDRVTSSRGVDAAHVARVLLAAAASPSALGRTVEVFSAPGPAVSGPEDVEALFAATRPDDATGWGVDDQRHVPLSEEPARVQADVARFDR